RHDGSQAKLNAFFDAFTAPILADVARYKKVRIDSLERFDRLRGVVVRQVTFRGCPMAVTFSQDDRVSVHRL
ncbi:MAG: hypothetical protein ACREMT_08790, partial [Vulcanimicrobiaceae bacterium]